MKARPLTKGEILQLSPTATKNRMLAGCFLVVKEEKAFGCQGFVQCPGENGEPGGQAYYRPSWEELEETGGMAPWLPE